MSCRNRHYKECECGNSVHRGFFCDCGKNPWNIEPELYADAVCLIKSSIKDVITYIQKFKAMQKTLVKINKLSQAQALKAKEE